MGEPIRIQRKRTRGWRMPPNTVSVTRPSQWGNIYRVGDTDEATGQPITPARAVELFRQWVEPHRDIIQEQLRGKNLACFCKPGEPCHADVLLEIANAPADAPDQEKEAGRSQSRTTRLAPLRGI